MVTTKIIKPINPDYIGRFTYVNSPHVSELCIITGIDYMTREYIIKNLTKYGRYRGRPVRLRYGVLTAEQAVNTIKHCIDIIRNLKAKLYAPIAAKNLNNEQITNLYRILTAIVEIQQNIDILERLTEPGDKLSRWAAKIDYKYELAKAKRGMRNTMKRFHHFYGEDAEDIVRSILNIAPEVRFVFSPEFDRSNYICKITSALDVREKQLSDMLFMAEDYDEIMQKSLRESKTEAVL